MEDLDQEDGWMDAMVKVYENGELLKDASLQEIREKIEFELQNLL